MTSSIRAALAAIALLALVSASSACSREDEEALLSIMSSFPPNSFPSSWNSSADCCSWDYINCTAGRVTIFEILGNHMISGPLPPSIGRLSSLQTLFLNDIPNLSGPIPPQLTMLRNLNFLTISETALSGPVPAFLSRLPLLGLINLSANRHTGPIPASLGDLKLLGNLGLSGNRLTGTIPATLFSRAAKGSTIWLDLSRNQLTGPIPPSFGHVPFTHIDVSSNRLTGDASFLFGQSKRGISDIVLASNQLAFDLTNVEYPDHGFLNLLNISHNHIYGSISAQINRLQQLEQFDASYNRLCGQIPSGNILSFLSPSSFAHNDCLCGAPLPPCK